MPRSKQWLGILAAFALASCAGPQAARTPVQDRDSATRAYTNQQQLETELSGTYATDCARACELADEICMLSALICDIAWRNPQDAALEDMCFDANGRCETATAEVANRCECSSAEKLRVKKVADLPAAGLGVPVSLCFLTSLAT